MRGLPDSAVVGTYKRLARKPRRSRSHKDEQYYQDVADIMNGWVYKLTSFFRR
jgi:hypothetical protein